MRSSSAAAADCSPAAAHAQTWAGAGGCSPPQLQPVRSSQLARQLAGSWSWDPAGAKSAAEHVA
eukprot:2056914-Prymnesium_polylepis.1